MKRIYRVEYDEKWTGCGWVSDHKNVLANGDINNAVAKVKKNVLGQHFVAEDTGKMQRCVGFRATAVTVVAEAEL